MKPCRRISLVALNDPDNFSYSLALGYLKSYLMLNPNYPGLDVNVLNFNIRKQEVTDIAAGICGLRPDIVGFSCYVWNIDRIGDIIKIIKSALPEAVIVLGGPEVSGLASHYLEKMPLADIIVRGEGEATFSELVTHYSTGKPGLQGIHGISYRSGTGITENRPRQLIENLDDIPSPYLTGAISPEDISPAGLVETHRGCDFGCTYCYEGKNYSSIRYFSAARIVAEVRAMMSHRIKVMAFVGAAFNLHRDMDGICRALSMLGKKSMEISAELKCEFVDGKTAQLLGRAGVTMAGMGLQSVSKETNANVKRYFDLEKFRCGVLELKKNKVRIYLDVICGLPGDNFFRYARTVSHALNFDPANIYDFTLLVLPGTRLREAKMTHNASPPYEIYSNDTFSRDEIIRAKLFSSSVIREFRLP